MKMEENLNSAFCRVKYEPSENLSERVCQAIASIEKRDARLKFFSSSAITLASVWGVILAFSTLSADLAQSGFFEYWSLIFSIKITSYWQELSLSLAESLPTISIIIFLSLIFIFFLSLKFTMRQVSRNKLQLIT